MPRTRRPGSPQRRQPDPFAVPLGFKLWFAFCALMGLSLLGVAVWAVIMLVNHFTA